MSRFDISSLPIKSKLTLLAVSTSCAVLFIASAAFVANEIFTYRDSLKQHMSILADVIGINSGAALTFNDKRSAEETLSALKVESQVKAAAIYDAEGNMFAEYTTVNSVPLPTTVQSIGAFSVFFLEHFELHRPIMLDEVKIGTVYIVSGFGQLYERVGREGKIAFIILVLSMAVAFIISNKLQVLISKPILELARVAKLVSTTKNFSERVVTKNQDEIGELTINFNEMLTEIQQRDARLERHSEHLEAEVKRRTKELAVAYEAIKEKEASISSIIDSAADGIIITDQVGKILSLNRAAVEMFGHEANDILASDISTLFRLRLSVERRPAVTLPASFLQQLRTRNPSEEVLGIKKGGTNFPIELTISEAASNMVTIIARDLTQRKQEEAQLLHAQKLESLGQLSAGVAHEINTPIQYIGDNLSFLQTEFVKLQLLTSKFEDLLESARKEGTMSNLISEIDKCKADCDLNFLVEEFPKAISSSLDGVQRVTHIVKALKEFSHPSSVSKSSVNINSIISSTITVSRNEWKYVADVETELDPTLPLLSCYPGDLSQVILNMIVNAAHAIEEKAKSQEKSGEKGKITISTHSKGSDIEIRITDTGKGIPDEIRDKVFDPFFTTKAVGKGTGQGLAISYSIINDKHNGKITFESEMGQGTTFIIRIPWDEG